MICVCAVSNDIWSEGDNAAATVDGNLTVFATMMMMMTMVMMMAM